MIIGISGYSGSGKNAIGTIIQYLMCENKGNITIEEAIKDYKEHEWWLEDQSEWEVKSFASKLKDIASHLTGIDIEKFEDQDFKNTVLGREWWTTNDEGDQPMSVRDFLQILGTNAIRNVLHPNTWVNAVMADYQPTGEFNIIHDATIYPNWIITDTRFINEAKAIKDKEGIIIRVDRPGVKPMNNHASETELDNWKFDYKIANVSDLQSLMFTVENILKFHKIIQ